MTAPFGFAARAVPSIRSIPKGQKPEKLTSVPSDVFTLAAAEAHTLYVLNRNRSETNRLWGNSGGDWKEVPSPTGVSLQDISVGTDGALWALDENGRAWLYLNGTWIRQIMPTDMWGATGGHKVTEVVTGKRRSAARRRPKRRRNSNVRRCSSR
jgi:hypothetical protein